MKHVPALLDTLDQQSVSQPTPGEPTSTQSLPGFDLDSSQEAVLKDICGLEHGDLSLIVGPPGSGKTEVIAKAADELATQGERVLVTSHTNIAVDNVVEKLADYSTHDITRAGRPEKLSKGTQELMLSKVIERNDDTTVQELLTRVDELKAKISSAGGRAASDDTQGELADLRRHIRELQEQAEAESIRGVDIVGATIIPAAFKDKKLARYLVRLLETSLTRAVDKQDAEPLLDELRKPYVITARAKGVRPFKLIMKYPVRIALNPFVSGLSGIFPRLISGAAIVGIVMSLPTIGPMQLNAIRSMDMYLAGSLLMVLSLLTVFGTLVSDLLLMAIDPRIRMGGSGE